MIEKTHTPLTIAIDGPGGAGKSTIAKALAEALGILHLDTGAMYRALGLKALRAGVDPQDASAAEALCAETDIAVALGETGQCTLLDGEDVTALIRTPAVSAAASAVSKAGGVRARMVALQQAYAQKADMVLDGRDIGTRVLPNATHKFFLNASSEVRARRRYDELRAKGVDCAYEQVLAEMIARDRQDSERAVDPLRCAADATEIDTTLLSAADVLAALLRAIGEERT
ncbi:MAG: (d)CMP kinase [Oscillospiraceae bacterium]|jgi:cytidylate kinase|nr:(d)CMP kinase [Oscillospiraceae bacterium]